MLDEESGEVEALDSDGNRIPEVLDPNETGVAYPSNESLSLVFDEEQKVVKLETDVSSNVLYAEVEYQNDQGENVSIINILQFLTLVCPKRHGKQCRPRSDFPILFYLTSIL